MAAPSTPRRAVANSSKKRTPCADLTRPTPGGSHGTKMAAIFQDAARSLDSLQTPTKSCSSNTKRSRIPLSQAKTVRFGSSRWDKVKICSPMESPALVGGGGSMPADVPYGKHLSMPIARSHKSNSMVMDQDLDVTYPTLNEWKSPQASSKLPGYDSTEEDNHSSHGVPLILPLHYPKPATQPRSVNSWLDEVLTPSAMQRCSTVPSTCSAPPEDGRIVSVSAPPSVNSTPPVQNSSGLTVPPNAAESSSNPSERVRPRPSISPSVTSSRNKENHPPASPPPYPSLLPSSPHPTTDFLSANLSRFGLAPSPVAHSMEATSSIQSHHPLPYPPPHQPSKGLKAASTSPGTKSSTVIGPNLWPRSTKIQTRREDESEDAVVIGLSPEVEMYRKGKGRQLVKKGRCASYYDEDIMGPGAGIKPAELNVRQNEDCVQGRWGRKAEFALWGEGGRKRGRNEMGL